MRVTAVPDMQVNPVNRLGVAEHQVVAVGRGPGEILRKLVRRAGFVAGIARTGGVIADMVHQVLAGSVVGQVEDGAVAVAAGAVGVADSDRQQARRAGTIRVRRDICFFRRWG